MLAVPIQPDFLPASAADIQDPAAIVLLHGFDSSLLEFRRLLPFDFVLDYPDWMRSLVLSDRVDFSGSLPVGQ